MAYLGIDVGTAGTKALLVDGAGKALGRGYREYPLSFPREGWVEQNAEDWWGAVIGSVRDAVRTVGGGAVEAISLSTQGATMLAVDGANGPLCPAMTWMDRRAERECGELVGAVGEEEVYRVSGWPASPVQDAAKVAWLRRNEPELFRGAAAFVSTVEYVNHKLVGRHYIDPTNAAMRQMADVRTGAWDAGILGFLGIGEDRLPEIVPSGAPIGTLTGSAASALGLPKSVRVYCGAHDQYCAAMGCGLSEEGEVLAATGTTWVILAMADSLRYTKTRLAPGVFPLSGKYGVMASLVSAGSALKWWRGVTGCSYAEMDEAAASRMGSASGLLVAPYLAGAGIGHPEGAKAVMRGMTLGHDRHDVALAIMEGVAFEARLILEEYVREGIAPDRLIVSGGAAGSRLWRGILGAVTGLAVEVAAGGGAAGGGERPGMGVTPDGADRREAAHSGVLPDEAGCLGAAMMAAVGEGAYAGLGECSRMMVGGREAEPPDGARRAFYEDKYGRYLRFLKDHVDRQ